MDFLPNSDENQFWLFGTIFGGKIFSPHSLPKSTFTLSFRLDHDVPATDRSLFEIERLTTDIDNAAAVKKEIGTNQTTELVLQILRTFR